MRRLAGIPLIILIIIGIIMMGRITAPYFSFRYDIDFLLTKQYILYSKLWRYSFYIHISTSLFVIAIGLLQFVIPVKNTTKTFHRNAGIIYVLLVLIFAAPSGIVLGYFSNGGTAAATSFILTAGLWWFFTWKAFSLAKQRLLIQHSDYMLRSYALTLSALTLRMYALFLPSIILMPAKQSYVLIAWLSWIPNLLIAEFLIRKKIFSGVLQKY